MIKLFQGDCLEVMKDIPDNSVDCVICDLPYGTTSCAWDIVIPFDKLWGQYERITKQSSPIILFGQEPFSSYLRLSNIKMFKYDWYWEKERITNIMQVKKRPGKTIETISVFYKIQPSYFPQMTIYTGTPRSNKVKSGVIGGLSDNNKSKVKEYNDNGTRYPTQVLKFTRDVLVSNLHPTQKPVALIEYLIKTYTNENDVVLDNTMGSGTTGVACKNLFRSFIGIEQDEKYFQIAKDRVNNTNVMNL